MFDLINFLNLKISNLIFHKIISGNISDSRYPSINTMYLSYISFYTDMKDMNRIVEKKSKHSSKIRTMF